MHPADDLAGDTLRVGRTLTGAHELTAVERAAVDSGELVLAGDGDGSMQLMRAPSPAKRRESWQRALELGARVNFSRRLERERIAVKVGREAIRRGDRDAAVLAGFQAREADQAARRDHKLLYKRAVRERGDQPRTAPPRVARARGAGRPRASASRSSSGDSGDSSGSSEGGEPPGLAALLHGGRR